MGVLRKLRGVVTDDRGLSTVEYVVLLVLIVATSVGVWNEFGDDLYKKLDTAKTSFGDNVSTQVDDG